MPAQDSEAGVRGVIDVPMVDFPPRTKIDVLSIGAFPEAANAELAQQRILTNTRVRIGQIRAVQQALLLL